MPTATSWGFAVPTSRTSKTLRMDPRLWDALNKVAEKRRRSVNNLIEDILATHIEVSEEWALAE